MFPRIDGLRAMEIGTPGPSRDGLTALIVQGDKRGTAGLLSEYETEQEALEHVGERLVLVDSNGSGIGFLTVTAVHVTTFGEVTWEFAQSEGEGDAHIDEWRDSHRRYFASIGRQVDHDTPMVCVSFTFSGPTTLQEPLR